MAKLIACVGAIFGRNNLSHTFYKTFLFSEENVTLGSLHKKIFKSNAKQHVTNIKNTFFVLIPNLSVCVGFQNDVHRHSA